MCPPQWPPRYAARSSARPRGRWPGWSLPVNSGRTTSCPRCSTRMCPLQWPPRSATRLGGGGGAGGGEGAAPAQAGTKARPSRNFGREHETMWVSYFTRRRVSNNREMEEDLAGRLLVATPLLGDPNFRRTVILVVEDEPDEGTLGVVLNRPTEVPVGQVLESWTELVTGPSVVFRGGPVAPNSALALAIVPGDDEPVGWRALDGSKLMSRVGLVDLDAPPQLLAGGIASLRVFAGDAGWSPGRSGER